MRRLVKSIMCFFVAAAPVLAAAPDVPKVDKVLPIRPSPLVTEPGVFFHEEFDAISDLSDQFQNVGSDNGNFFISNADHLSGGRSLRQKYRPLTDYATGEDPGSAGWVGRFFGNKQDWISTIPAEQQHPYYTAVASWYHKFEEGFQPRNGVTFPPKMGRFRCYEPYNWNTRWSILFWIGGDDGHISIERHTSLPQAHREWLPNHAAGFRFSDPVNVGRWIHFELRVALGKTPRSDRIQAWADGLLICDIAGDDVAAGDTNSTLNCMQWDCYWNGGSPVEQNRYFDDLVLSTERVGPLRAELNPELVKNDFSGAGADTQGGWELEIAQGVQRQPVKDEVLDGVVTRYSDPQVDYSVVWRGAVEGDAARVTVDTLSGEFTGPRAGESTLAANTLHFARVRQKNQAGEWSDWSPWHAGFATDWEAGTPDELKTLPAGYLAEADAAVVGMDDTPPLIRQVQGPSSVTDTAGPYEISAEVVEENPLNVYLYYRLNGQGDYDRVLMERGVGDTFTGLLPGCPAGTQVEYYIRALDGFEHYTYLPADYTTSPFRLEVLESMRWDLDGDGRVGVGDVLKLLLAGRRNSQDSALDYDGDGEFGMGDLLTFIRTIAHGGAGMLAGVGN